MTVEGVRALRERVAISRLDHVTCVRMSGERAFRVLDYLCSSDLFIEEGQMLHTLFLSSDGLPLADVYICCDDESYILLMEGLSFEAFDHHVRSHVSEVQDLEIVDLRGSYDLLSLGGPFAWELMGELVGPDVVGQPYLTFFYLDEERGLCFRAGKTGEFGYDLLLERASAPRFIEHVHELGRRFELTEASLQDLDQCALENGFFNIRREGQSGLSPLELQLQWRLSRSKTFVGSEALQQKRAANTWPRITWITSLETLEEGTPVYFDEFVHDEPVGRVLTGGYSSMLGLYVAIALLERELAHPGCEALRAGAARVGVSTKTVPLLANLSLFVDVQQHDFASSAEALAKGELR